MLKILNNTISNNLILFSIFFLACGLLVSSALMLISQALLLCAVLATLNKFSWKKISKSQVCIMLFAVTATASIFFNRDIQSTGYFNTRYYYLAFFGGIPLTHAFENYIDLKKKKILLYVALVCGTFSGMIGIIALHTGIHPITSNPACHVIRNCGMFGMYMNYSHSLIFFICILISLIIFHKKIQQYISLKWLLVFALINTYFLYSTFTRGVWLAILIAIPFCFYKNNKKSFGLVLLSVVVVAVNMYLFIPKVHETFSTRQGSNDERIGSWKAALKAFEERPILGYGLNNFEPHSVEIKLKYQINNPYFKGHAHNNFLEILATTGGVGFAFFVLWLFFWTKEMLLRNDLISNIAIPFIVAFFIAGATQSTFVLAPNVIFIMSFYLLTQVNFQEKSE